MRSLLTILGLAGLLLLPPPAGAADNPTAGLVLNANRTGLALLDREMERGTGNAAVSPANLSRALAILSMAGKGPGPDALRARLLGPDARPAALPVALAALDKALARPPAADGAAPPLLQTAALWHAPDAVPVARPPKHLAALIDGGPRPLKGVEDINGWVRQATAGRIPTLLDRLAEDTPMVLATALLFKDDWSFPFETSQTRPAPFTNATGLAAEVEMMQREDRMLAVRDGSDGTIGVSLGYRNGYNLLLLLPPAGTPVAALLTPEGTLADPAFMDGSTYGRMSALLVLPRVQLTQRLELTGPDAAMPDLIAGPLDLSRLLKGGPWPPGRAVHAVSLSWDEKGTELAAATAIAASRGMSEDVREIRFDRPFLFLLRDGATGLILAAGRVDSPKS